jgi:hypothetical protein
MVLFSMPRHETRREVSVRYREHGEEDVGVQQGHEALYLLGERCKHHRHVINHDDVHVYVDDCRRR